MIVGVVVSFLQAYAEVEEESKRAMADNRQLRKLLQEQAEKIQTILNRLAAVEQEKKSLVWKSSGCGP